MRRLCAMLALCLLLPLCALAQETDDAWLPLNERLQSRDDALITNNQASSVPLYRAYLAACGQTPVYRGADVAGALSQNDGDVTAFTVDAPQDALYCITVTYAPRDLMDVDAQRLLTIDGSAPFLEARTVMFRWWWMDAHEPIRNSAGDEVNPGQTRLFTAQQTALSCAEGYISGALMFRLTKGAHTIAFARAAQEVDIQALSLTAPIVPLPYAEVSKDYTDAMNASDSVVFNAETSVSFKNSAAIRRIAAYDPMTTPFEYGYTRLNTIHSWDGGQRIAWNFTVPEDGLYTLSLRCRVDTERLPVYRMIGVDDAVPFEELLAYKIPYSADFQAHTLQSPEGEPYRVFLKAGEHTLWMEAVIGEYYDIILSLQNDDAVMSKLILDLLMFVGANPDLNYDYKIVSAVPDIVPRLTSLQSSLLDKASAMERICGGESLVASSLRSCASLLARTARDVQYIQKHMEDLSNIQTTLATWQDTLEVSSLLVDTFKVGQAGENLHPAASAWQTTLSTLRSFMISFQKDYDAVGAVNQAKEKVVLDVWMTTSTERAMIFKELCDESFTPATGIGIRLNIMPAGQLNTGAVNALLLSLVSDSAPDVALCVGAGTPVELAIREAALDLSKMPGYDALAAQYLPAALNTNSLLGGVYGLPATMDFQVLMYRKDILSDLGVAIPQTWQDIYDYVLPTLNQNNLSLYIPQNFCTFLYQHGGAYYTPDGLTSLLDSEQAHAAFCQMVELYTKYGIPYTTNFYNRFKTGDTPMGVASFGEYMSLTVGASNLAGKWGIALIPGTKREDGSIDRSFGGAAAMSSAFASSVTASSVILSDTEYPDEAWAFLQWWGSEETQLDYALQLETRLGVGARYNTANMRAFANLPWQTGDAEILLEALSSFTEPGGVLGGYYTNRHIANAWNSMITGTTGDSVYELIDQANENIQNELSDKQNEYRHLLSGSGEAR